MSDADKLFGLLKADANCKSLLKKALTEEVFNELKDKKSKFNGTLVHCIRSGKIVNYQNLGVFVL